MSNIYSASKKIKEINPGELNKKIQIIKHIDGGVNENGFQMDPEEKVIRKCWAKVTNTSGSESVKMSSDFSNTKKRFLVRYTPVEIDASMVIRYAGKDYDIEYVNNYNEGHEYIEIWTSRNERVGYDGKL